MSTSIWQQALEHGQAEEALKHYRQDYSDEKTLEGLKALVSMQEMLREKNAAQAQKIIGKPEFSEELNTLVNALHVQLSALAEIQHDLDRHDVDKILATLNKVQHPLLLGEAETLRGTALIYQNDTLGAKAAFERALSYDPRHYRAITNLGNVALENNQLEEAVLYYEKALKINEHFSNAHHNLAVAYKRKGEVGKSVQALKQAQRASQQKMKDEAKGMFKSSRATKYLRWIFFAGIAIVVYLFFRNRT